MFHRQLKNLDISRQSRRIGREQNEANARSRSLQTQVADLDLDDEKRSELLDRIEEQDDLALEKTYETIQLLLVDENGEQPSRELLTTMVDLEEVGRLASILLGEEEPAEGPTQTATTSS